jgi:hypothetical protein
MTLGLVIRWRLRRGSQSHGLSTAHRCMLEGLRS